jgi:uridine kinase
MRIINSSAMIVAGPSQAGKTTFVNNLVSNAHLILKNKVSKIHWICNEKPTGDDYHAEYDYIEGVPDDFSFVEKNSIIIIDDLMQEVRESTAITSLFSRVAHHKNAFIIYITQNYFNPSEEERTRRRNCHYTVLFKNPADARQIRTVGSNMFPEQPKLLPAAYRDAVSSTPHGYIFLDLRQETPEILRLRSRILPHELPMVVYKRIR